MRLDLGRVRTMLGGTAADTPVMRWSIAMICVILAWFWLVEPLQAWHDGMAEQMQRNVRKAARLQALQERAQEWAVADAQAVQALQQQLGLLFLQATDTAAQAVLQQLLARQVEARGLNVVSQKLTEPELVPGIGQKLSLAFNLKGELGSVLQLIDDVSRANHIVEIESLLMRRERDGKINVSISLSGYRGELAGLTANES